MTQKLERVVSLGDRVVSFARYGREGGRRVVFHFGTPGTRHLGPRMTRIVDARAIDLVVLERPGYGESTRRPGRSVADVVSDVVAVVTELGWDRFAVWGGSGGGPHALACAALVPDLVERCACVVSPAPFAAEGLDWFDGMPPGNVEELSLAVHGDAAVRPLVERLAAEAVAAVEAGVIPLGAEYELTEADRAALQARLSEPGYLERTRASNTGAIDGWIDDLIAFTGSWGFDLADIAVPVSIWSAAHDSLCPPAHSDWLASHVPSAEARLLPHGHILDEVDLDAIYGWLVQGR